MAVLDPVKVVIENYPEDKTEYFEVLNNPEDENAGTRKIPFTRELYIERDDFALDPPPKFHRLKEGSEVRLMGAYIIKCVKAETDENGVVTRIICTADLETKNGNPVDGRKVKGTIHWVSASENVKADANVYDLLFTKANINDLSEGEYYLDYLNPESLKEYKNCVMEKSLAEAKPGDKFQFVRLGYFCRDSKSENMVFNRTVTLKDTWSKKK